MVKLDIAAVEISSRCNLKCSYCGRQHMKRKPGHMPMKIAEETAKQLAEINPEQHITFNVYGESLLNPKAVDIIKLFKNARAKKVLHTNCTIYRPDLIDAGLWELVLHVDAIEGERYKVAHQYLHNGRKIPSILIQCLVSPETEPIITQFIERFLRFTRDAHREIIIKYPILNPMMNVTQEFKGPNWKYMDRIPGVVFAGRPYQTRGLDCPGLDKAVYILSDGTIILHCCSPNKELAIGNIFEGIEHCLNKPETKAMLKDYPNISPCKECIEKSADFEREKTI